MNPIIQKCIEICNDYIEKPEHSFGCEKLEGKECNCDMYDHMVSQNVTLRDAISRMEQLDIMPQKAYREIPEEDEDINPWELVVAAIILGLSILISLSL